MNNSSPRIKFDAAELPGEMETTVVFEEGISRHGRGNRQAGI